MKITRQIVLMAALTGFAFIVGRSTLGTALDASAHAQDSPADEEMQAMMDAWMQAGMPGEHHKHLDRMVGEWDATFEMRPEPGAPYMSMPGSLKREWVLGGRFVRETVSWMVNGEEFTGVGYIGYDNFDQQYTMTWFDSASTQVHTETGIYDEATQTLRMSGKRRDLMSNRLVTSWGELSLADPDKLTFTGWSFAPDGSVYDSWKGTFVRK